MTRFQLTVYIRRLLTIMRIGNSVSMTFRICEASFVYSLVGRVLEMRSLLILTMFLSSLAVGCQNSDLTQTPPTLPLWRAFDLQCSGRVGRRVRDQMSTSLTPCLLVKKVRTMGLGQLQCPLNSPFTCIPFYLQRRINRTSNLKPGSVLSQQSIF